MNPDPAIIAFISLLLTSALGALLAVGKYSSSARDAEAHRRFEAVEADAAKCMSTLIIIEELKGSIHVLEERQANHASAMSDIRATLHGMSEKMNEILERLPRRRNGK